MTPFFLTQMGRKFFDADVPRIIRALEGIANGLGKPVKPDFHKETQREAAAMMPRMTGKPGHPLIIGDLSIENLPLAMLSPDCAIRITSKEGHVVDIYRPGGEHAVFISVDGAFEIKLGDELTIEEE